MEWEGSEEMQGAQSGLLEDATAGAEPFYKEMKSVLPPPAPAAPQSCNNEARQ